MIMQNEEPPVVNVAALTLEHWTQGELYESSDTSFGRLIGLTGLGASYNEVPPGKSGCPFHNHHVEDEMFFIIEGTGEYRFGTERYPIRKGDALAAPAGGPETAHQIINTGATTLIYLGVSTMAKTEIVEYPDSGKFLAKSRRDDADNKPFRFVGRHSSNIDYWDGESGA
jgi:uncharacterized cupin superfamily protein